MKKWILLIFTFIPGIILFCQSHSIIPKPVDVKYQDGSPFIITGKTPLFFVSGRIMANVIEFNSLLKQIHGIELPWTTEVTNADQPIIYLELIKDSLIPSEGYRLISTTDYIKITATHRHGLFYGLISLIQLMTPLRDGDGSFMVPLCSVEDYPRFAYRGMHLDVCRHFFGKEFIKKYIDLLALHKMNTFHWHLTDDQGWRIEIKKFPLLTQIGGWRNGSMVGHYRDQAFDTIRYGGYYTQEDIREIVKYADSRHVNIIPEIEMPGHALAALAAYPQFSCTGGPFEVSKEWGVFEDVYCAGNENTYQFIEDILTEVTNLFPGKYIHIGGDECPKERWKNCGKCQQKMKEEGLKDEHELQSYFIQRIEKFLNSKGKQIIGWDEILEGGLAPNATVMSWRGEKGGIEAAKQYHAVIMTPGDYCYFDHYQGNPEMEPVAIGGYTPIEQVYQYEPVPNELPDSLQKYILGAQANVWTEYMLSEQHVEYMAYPRAIALAEVLWTPKEHRNQGDFQHRLIDHLMLLDKLKVNYSTSMYQVKVEVVKNSGMVGLVGSTYFKNKNIMVSVSPINEDSDHYKTISGDENKWPILIRESSIVKFKIEGGSAISQQNIYLHKAIAKSIRFTNDPDINYNTQSDFTLVNGVKASVPRQNHEWNAWYGEDVEILIDLESITEIDSVIIGYLDEKSNWIWLPAAIEIHLSANGKKYKLVHRAGINEIMNNSRELMLSFKKQKAQYVKVKVFNPGKIPTGYPGEGKDSWMFFDEIQIK